MVQQKKSSKKLWKNKVTFSLFWVPNKIKINAPKKWIRHVFWHHTKPQRRVQDLLRSCVALSKIPDLEIPVFHRCLVFLISKRDLSRALYELSAKIICCITYFLQRKTYHRVLRKLSCTKTIISSGRITSFKDANLRLKRWH